MSEEEQKYFKGLIGFTFDSDDIKYIEKIVDKKDKEIERLNNLLKETSQTLSKQTVKAITLKSENERLNNIINELEEWLKEKQFERIDNVGIYALYETVLQKIQELKGSDKE